MPLRLAPEEPDLGPWQVLSIRIFIDALTAKLQTPSTGPLIIAIDGRSASGKSTLAAALRKAVPGASVVHTDDVAWHHDFFDWAELLLDGVLEPARSGQSVHYRPPAWRARGREGAIEVPDECALLFVEGVGAARRELTQVLDAALWVQSDAVVAASRGVARDGGDTAAQAFWDEWMARELPFQAAQRPWERADAVICGTPDIAHDPAKEVVVSTRSRT